MEGNQTNHRERNCHNVQKYSKLRLLVFLAGKKPHHKINPISKCINY